MVLRFEHRRRNGSNNFEEALSSARSTVERSATPSNPESTRRRANTQELEKESKRDLRSGNRSLRTTRVSQSPTGSYLLFKHGVLSKF